MASRIQGLPNEPFPKENDEGERKKIAIVRLSISMETRARTPAIFG
jgi:hypothetical protein